MRPERSIPTLQKLEVRSEGNEHIFEGYAAVFGSPSRPMPYIETVEPGAFARSLTNPPNGRQTFVIDHDDTQLAASTLTGRLRLAEDSVGLITEARCVDTSYVRDYRELAEAGEASGMSFEFSATKTGAPFSADGKRRALKEVRLFHVTALTGKTPAYAETTAAMRALANGIAASLEDVGSLLDAVREGRKLTSDEWQLLQRGAATVAPEGAALRYSSAAWDASAASWALGTLLDLLGDENAPGNEQQAEHLRTAIAEVQAFIALETAKVGSEADKLESNSLPTPNLEAARALIGV